MTVAGKDDDMLRLITVIDHQRRELDRIRAMAAGESVVAMIARVSNWLDTQLTTSGEILAVTHASVIRAAIVCALEAEPRSFWHIDIAPLSLTQLSGNGGRWTLVSIGSGKADSRTDGFH